MLNPIEVARTTDAPCENAEPVFKTPWEARIFALTAQLASGSEFAWNDFKCHLINSIKKGDPHDGASDDDFGTTYYRAWLSATETFLKEVGVCDDTTLEARIHELQSPDLSGKLSPTGSEVKPVSKN